MVIAVVAPVRPHVQPKSKSSVSIKCPKCGGRLFLNDEFEGSRLHYFMECVCCGKRQAAPSDVIPPKGREGWHMPRRRLSTGVVSVGYGK